MQYRTLRCWTVLLVGLIVVAGCGTDGVKTVDVSGTVYLDDQPAAGVTVFFITDDHTGTGKTGVDGKYTLDNGAQPGQNKVYFSKIAGSDLSGEAVDDGEMAADMPDEGEPSEESAAQPEGEQLPAKYTDPLNPPETFTVPEGGTSSADFRLTSE